MPHGMLLYGRRAKRIAVEQGFDSDSIWIVYNSLNYVWQKVVRIGITADHRRGLRLKLFGSTDVPVVVCISRLTSLRRLDILINALSNLKKRGEEHCLLLIGDGPERSNLEAQARSLNIRLHCTGALYDESEIGPLLSCATVTVAPGKVGLTAMHSLAYGVPVLTHGDFDNQMPECEAIVPGLTGDFFRLGDESDIASTIYRWTREVEVPEAIRQKCIAVIEQFYNADAQLEIIESAIFCGTPPLTIGDAVQPEEI